MSRQADLQPSVSRVEDPRRDPTAVVCDPGRSSSADGQDPFVQDAIDLLPVGVVLVDSGCQVVRANPSAVRMLLEGSGLWEEEGGLATGDPERTREIRELVRDGRAAAAFSLARGPRKRRLALRIVPLRNGTRNGRATAALFLSDGEHEIDVDPELLTQLYGLTASEAAIVSRLLQGWEVRDIARERGVQENTIRSHLKSVFARTGTRSQADLVRLLLTGPAVLRSLA